ncbi:hypothetical protein BZG36_00408 [Bifiguratus adelaidae]|uniref:DAGKc domain-containing protein n=1 Tax=Bifiguratus adelaidae TaxID=1938954 RepID=A0A261Y860_9FUNG|nr:hypothetical protein BZG36_00408 [Bifiguratus adelaidae]
MLELNCISHGGDTVTLQFDGKKVTLVGAPAYDNPFSGPGCCCYAPPPKSALPPPSIASLNLLHSAYDESSHQLTLKAAIPKHSNGMLGVETFQLEVLERDKSLKWCQAVMKSAYRDSRPGKRFLVLINPFSGQGKAKDIWNQRVKAVFDAAEANCEVIYTTHANHAAEIALDFDLAQYNAVVTVSGDGIIHELINGILKRPDGREVAKRLPIGPVPGGTGNALVVSLLGHEAGADPVVAAVQVIKGRGMDMDICSITYAQDHYYSFLTQNYGITAYADLATEGLRWLGDTRTTLGVLKEIVANSSYGAKIQLDVVKDDKAVIKRGYNNACSLPRRRTISGGATSDKDMEGSSYGGPDDAGSGSGSADETHQGKNREFLQHADTQVLTARTEAENEPQSEQNGSVGTVTKTTVHGEIDNVNLAEEQVSSPSSPSGKPAVKSAFPESLPALSQPLPDDWLTIEGDIKMFFTSKVPWIARDLLSHPCALPDDGLLDVLILGTDVTRADSLSLLPKFETGAHLDDPKLKYYKIRAFRFEPRMKPGQANYVAIDGEHAAMEESLHPTFLEIVNESHLHAHHEAMRGNANPETHFKVTVVSEEFAGKTLMQRHRQLYALLDNEIKGGVHALSLKAKTPQEWTKE